MFFPICSQQTKLLKSCENRESEMNNFLAAIIGEGFSNSFPFVNLISDLNASAKPELIHVTLGVELQNIFFFFHFWYFFCVVIAPDVDVGCKKVSGCKVAVTVCACTWSWSVRSFIWGDIGDTYRQELSHPRRSVFSFKVRSVLVNKS